MSTKKKALILSGVFGLLMLLRVLAGFLTYKFSSPNDSPAFVGPLQYLKLFIQDRYLLLALFNTLLLYLLFGLISVFVLTFIRYRQLKKSAGSVFELQFFPLAFVVLFLANRSVVFVERLGYLLVSSIRGDSDSIILFMPHLFDTILAAFRPAGLLDAGMFALFFCFILLVVDWVLKRKNKSCERNAHQNEEQNY